jgi:hypothetical protein
MSVVLSVDHKSAGTATATSSAGGDPTALLVSELGAWTPTASQLKLALDAVCPVTGLLSDLNAIIAAFGVDLSPPLWTRSSHAPASSESIQPVSGMARHFVLRLPGPYSRRHWYSLGDSLLVWTSGEDWRLQLVGSKDQSHTICSVSDTADSFIWLEVEIVATGRESGVLTVRQRGSERIVARFEREGLAHWHIRSTLDVAELSAAHD